MAMGLRSVFDESAIESYTILTKHSFVVLCCDMGYIYMYIVQNLWELKGVLLLWWSAQSKEVIKKEEEKAWIMSCLLWKIACNLIAFTHMISNANCVS